MKFIREKGNIRKYTDTIFSVVSKAKNDCDPDKINATAGVLCDEQGKLLTYQTVFNNEKNISDIQKAGYASSPAGNRDFIEAITNYILENKVHNPYDGIATVGGTGAIYTAIKLCLDEKDTIMYPEIAWGNYQLMAQEFNLNSLTYDVYNLDDLFSKINENKEKVFLIINSPCENPLGHSYSYKQWSAIIDKLNSCGKEVVLLLDNAYMDYANNNPKQFFDLFNRINDNVLILIAGSCSKSFSYYGVRLGVLICIHNNKNIVDSFINMAARLARTTWSNVSNGAMNNITQVLNEHFSDYVKERDNSIEMLRKRSQLFIKQAQENNLDFYPYSDGFFVTLKIEDPDKRDIIHQRLLNDHVYTIKVNKGIRVGICSVPLAKIDGLACRIKKAYLDLDNV